MGFLFISSSAIEQHHFISGIEGTLFPQFKTLTEIMIIPVLIFQRRVKNNYFTIRFSADHGENQYIERIWETVSPKFRIRLEN